MVGTAPNDYWNHNSAFHPWLRRQVAGAGGGRVLDVGCGDGLLLQRLLPVADEVVGIDTDPAPVERAKVRVAGRGIATLLVGDVLTDRRLTPGSFDVITCVSTLHHLPLEPALTRLAELLRPGGTLLVVGLSANRTAWDWAVDIAVLAPVKLIGKLRGEQRDIGVVIARPEETLRELRAAAGTQLPGARVRRRFYYRYSLAWRKPPAG